MIDLSSVTTHMSGALALLQSPQAGVWAHRVLEWAGVLFLVPKLGKVIVPKVKPAADKIADLLLQTPVLGTVVLTLAPDIIECVDQLADLADTIVAAFRDEFDRRLKEAAAKSAPAPASENPASPTGLP